MALRTTAVFLCFAAVCLQLVTSENWALLVAGSNGYYNYRHQADVCHAYHILRSHGVPQENIVTMMYDDIAYSEENPFPGNIINQPNGRNVYPGVVIDYKKKDVTPEVFLAVLSGNEKKVKKLTGKDGKVIKSGPDDHVFVNFVDHGAPGILAFPAEMLHARKLLSTLENMYKKKSYKKLVLYVEACESGSMFYNLLPDNINVFATTAANRSQSSYACYYDKKRGTYLGDVYSVMWMQDSDKEDLETETLQKQFQITRSETNTSQVKEYGDLSISKMTVAEFQGDEKADASMSQGFHVRHPTEDAVPAREASFHIMLKKLDKAKTPQEKRNLAQKIDDLIERNAQIDQLFVDMMKQLESRETGGELSSNLLLFRAEVTYVSLKSERRDITQWECYERAVDTLMESCPKLDLPQNYYAMGQLYMLVNLCERGINDYFIANAIWGSSLQNAQLCRDSVESAYP
ncbi:legumain-like [Babylonia areolata]|uniref:legumain-like n=1 Tax=Babylonia areolata TaxID=304850 RepID=UPI003FD0691E